jgi:hypothetical protein
MIARHENPYAQPVENPFPPTLSHQPMKPRIALLLACGSLLGISTAQTIQTYTDATGEIHANVGNHPHLDITSVVVTVNAAATDVTIRINLQGSPLASGGSNWGKYLVGIRSGGGGSTTSNGWGRPIYLASGMTRWIGTWADAAGDTCDGQIYSYSGSWSPAGAPTSVTKDATGITITTSVASLGMDPGETIAFDVYTSGGGGGDSAVDALSAAASSITGWGGPFTTSVVGGTPNPALTFTMPGTASYATWIAQFGLDPSDQDPSDDPDNDNLTNQQEYDADLGLNPSLADTDSDGLQDNVETGTGIYVSPSNTGSLPASLDSDSDGYNDGEEVDGSAFAYVGNPNKFNHSQLAVAGSFLTPQWDPTGGTDGLMGNGTSLTDQYQWSVDAKVTAAGSIEYKFTNATDWSSNVHWQWGATGNPSLAVRNGGNIVRSIAASGIHRIQFNTDTLTHSITRLTYANSGDFLESYGVLSGLDTDGDGILNQNEFTANTDPTNADTDGDGQNDSVDSNPLQATRDVVFSVNMSVQETLGNFNPNTGSVVVKFFTGALAGLPDLALTEVGNTGVYTGTLSSLIGPVGGNSGGYKFFNTTTGAPNSGYEEGFDRSFTLGAVNTPQTLSTVYFSNNSSLPGSYGAWAATNAGGQTADQDFDGDGVDNGIEYFMGQTGSSFTANPQPVAGIITWPRDPASTGVTFRVVTSPNLSTWTDVTSTPAVNTSNPNFVSYSMPMGETKFFVRLEVVVPE